MKGFPTNIMKLRDPVWPCFVDRCSCHDSADMTAKQDIQNLKVQQASKHPGGTSIKEIKRRPAYPTTRQGHLNRVDSY